MTKATRGTVEPEWKREEVGIVKWDNTAAASKSL